MTFRNENKVPFIDCTPEQQLEIILAMKENRCEVLFSFNEDFAKRSFNGINFESIYRVEQRKTVINWDMIPDEFKWFSFDRASSYLDFWSHKPLKVEGYWRHSVMGIVASSIPKELATKIAQLGDESWDESLQKRSE